jgi:hypothetical protein
MNAKLTNKYLLEDSSEKPMEISGLVLGLSSNKGLMQRSSFVISHNTETLLKRLFNKELLSKLKMEIGFYIRDYHCVKML